MRNHLRIVAAALPALLAVGGCRALSSPGDYALYRAYRYEPVGPDRLAAGGRYLAAYENGAFAPEVREIVQAQEEDFWSDHRSGVDGLQEYLRAFPRGMHADEARERLAVFERARAQQEAERRANQDAERQRREAELREAAVRQRLWMRGHFNRWTRLYGGLQGWGQGIGPIVQANPEFGAAFENDPPQCRASHCRKTYTLDFYIPVPGRSAVPRRLNFGLDMVRVGTERQVNQTFFTVRNRGLTQWWELENQQAAEADSAEARETAVRWTMDQLRATLVASFPDARETPAELYGPPPEAVMQGVEEDENAAPEPVDPNACVIPSQPLGVRWSAIIGCAGATGARITAPAEATEAHARSLTSDEAPITSHACLRFDAYAAIDGEGMATDEGVAVSLIPACALRPAGAARPGVRPGAPARPGAAPARPGAPARPAARPAAARPAAAAPAAPAAP
jgi:hypothetical protein